MTHGIDRSELPASLRELLSDELDRGERLIWVDQPEPSSLGRKYVPQMLFGIPFFAFSIFWIAMAGWGMNGEGQDGPGWSFPLFGVPFVLVGLGMLCSPLYGRWQATRTAYALTDQRAIIFARQLTGMSIRSFRSSELRSVERKQRADGSGDLVFAREPSQYGGGENGHPIEPVGFLGVAKVKEVEDLLGVLQSDPAKDS